MFYAIIYLKMARIHARKKGKSGSTRPVEADLSFVTLKKKDVEKLILDMAKEDVKPSVIGITLRDKYGVPSVKAITGKSIGDILSEGKLDLKVPEDLSALVSKFTALKKHLNANPRDVHNKRGLILLESKIRRLSSYYKRVGKIADNWSVN